MKNLDWYIETAKKNTGIKSNRQLGPAIGVSVHAVSQYQTGRAWPTAEVMEQLATLCGVDVENALMHRALWMSNGTVKKAYANILHRLEHVALVALLATFAIMGSSGDAMASDLLSKVSTYDNNNIYYGKYWSIRKYVDKLKYQAIKRFLIFPYYCVK